MLGARPDRHASRQGAVGPGMSGDAGGTATPDRSVLAARFRRVRGNSGLLASRLTPEDQLVQSMPEASPVKWHLGHTCWLLEKLVLERFLVGYTAFDDRFTYLFNALKEPAETAHPAASRHLLSRPALSDVSRWREHVNAAVMRLIEEASTGIWPQIAGWIELALTHEEQHQELILSDIKHAFWSNPLRPAYQESQPTPLTSAPGQSWIAHPGGTAEIGYGGAGFSFDLEQPRHPVILPPFRMAGRLVTCTEYQEFMEDGGYSTASLWRPEGWALAQQEGWKAPLYWFKHGGLWHQFTLSGMRLVDGEEPVCHLSWFEADAFARWSGKRLPTEMEWEVMAAGHRRTGNLLDYGRLHPVTAACAGEGPWQMYGDGWEWTQSPLTPYPRHKPGPFAVGEFAMPRLGAGHMVLRGGSALTPGEMIRATYRHHLAPGSRWQMTCIRLAEDA